MIKHLDHRTDKNLLEHLSGLKRPPKLDQSVRVHRPQLLPHSNDLLLPSKASVMLIVTCDCNDRRNVRG